MTMWRRKKKSTSDEADRLMEMLGTDRRSPAANEGEPTEVPQRVPDDAAVRRIQSQALAQLEPQPGTSDEPPPWPEEFRQLTERVAALGETCERLESTIDQVRAEVRRLASQPSRRPVVALKSGNHQPRRSLAKAPGSEAPKQEANAADAPRFAAGGRPVTVVIANIPGFQDLMDMQRALNALQESVEASVTKFADGEASFELELRDPASAGQIVGGLCEISGRRLVIEEASPDERRMRLRLSEPDAEHPDGDARPERWPRS